MYGSCADQPGSRSRDRNDAKTDEVVCRHWLSIAARLYHVLIVLFVAAACQAPSSQKPGPPVSPPLLSRPAQPDVVPSYRIGALLPLTGPMATYGQECFRGIELAVDRWNREGGTVVRLVVRDTRSDRAVQQPLNALLDESRLSGVIGPLVSQQLEEAARLVEGAHLPLITPAATRCDVRQLSPYAFSTALTYPLQAEGIAAYAMGRLGYRRFAVIHPGTGYGRQLAQSFAEEVRRRGGEVVDVESYQEEEQDFTSLVTRLKVAVRRRLQEDSPTHERRPSGASAAQKKHGTPSRRGLDAIYLPGAFRQAALIAAQLRFQDVKVRLLGSSAWHSSDVANFPERSLLGGIFVDSFFAESKAPAVRAFVEAYRFRYHAEPTPFAAQAYEATELLLAGIRAVGTSGKRLRAFLEQADALPTLLGPASFNAKGVLNRRLVLLQVGEKGALEQVR